MGLKNDEPPPHSLERSVLLDLMVMCLLQSMVEDVYPADLAQLSYSLYAAESGVVVKCSGLSDKLPRLLETILQHFQTLHSRRVNFLLVFILAAIVQTMDHKYIKTPNPKCRLFLKIDL